MRETGIEPAPLSGLDPKSSASASSATLAKFCPAKVCLVVDSFVLLILLSRKQSRAGLRGSPVQHGIRPQGVGELDRGASPEVSASITLRLSPAEPKNQQGAPPGTAFCRANRWVAAGPQTARLSAVRRRVKITGSSVSRCRPRQ